MALKRLDHTGVVVEDLQAAVAFFLELGMELLGEATVGGEWADRLLALEGVNTDIAMVQTPDGRSRIELSAFNSPALAGPPPNAPVNVPGIPRHTFVVDSVDDTFERLRAHGAELLGEIAQYEDIYRYGYIRGPSGILIGLVEELR